MLRKFWKCSPLDASGFDMQKCSMLRGAKCGSAAAAFRLKFQAIHVIVHIKSVLDAVFFGAQDSETKAFVGAAGAVLLVDIQFDAV